MVTIYLHSKLYWKGYTFIYTIYYSSFSTIKYFCRYMAISIINTYPKPLSIVCFRFIRFIQYLYLTLCAYIAYDEFGLDVNPRKAPKYDINILPWKLQTSSSKINAMRKNCLRVLWFNWFYHNSVIRKQCSTHKHANDP